MAGGRRSSFRISEVIEKLDQGRNGAIAVKTGSPPFHERYNKARAVMEAIDDLVEELTGDRERLWAKPHG